MKFLNKLERKFGKYAIPNLPLIMIIGYVIGYVLTIFGLIGYFVLDPRLVMQGQVWRLFTWVLVPPSGLSIFVIITLAFYYSIGTNLERIWGTFRYNVYIFSGIIATVIGVMGLYFVGRLLNMNLNYSMASTYYLCMSIFLASAASYPDMQVMLYFIIPIKIKYLAILDVVLIGISFLNSGIGGKILIIMSLLNFIVFYFATRNYKKISPKEMKRKHTYKKQVKMARNGKSVTRHKCAICGRTEEDAPDLQFRFCSRCNGNYEYCEKHIFTHTHVK